MAEMKKIAEKDALAAIETGEFNKKLTQSNKKVAVILTQSWCYQWSMMESWIASMIKPDDLDIYYLIYDLEDFSDDFINFKETTWKNDAIPYIRYYIDGIFICDSNYVPQAEFFKILKIE